MISRLIVVCGLGLIGIGCAFLGASPDQNTVQVASLIYRVILMLVATIGAMAAMIATER